MMSYPRKLFIGTVLILSLGIQDKQCRKIVGKLWVGNHPRNLVQYFLDGIPQETKMEFYVRISKSLFDMHHTLVEYSSLFGKSS